MDFELRRAREKLEKEQKDRKEKAKLRLERERKAKLEANRHREAIESAQRSRRIHAMEAQIKAEQQMEETIFAGRGISFNRVLEAVPFEGSGDKIKLPPSCFNELSEQGAFDKGPLHFQLSVAHQDHESTHGSTHAGVLEFTADEGTVGIPPHIWNNLYSKQDPNTPLVEVKYVWLSKGTYAKLQSEELGFSDIPNHKAVLETTLRQHATLSQDDVLTVKHGVLTFHLRVLELKPSSSVSVLETDIEVDIMGPDSLPEKTTQHVLKPLTFGKSESGIINEGEYAYYKFSIDDDTWKIIALGDVEIEVNLDSESNGDTDLYLSRHPLLFPNTHQHGWSSHDLGSKCLVLGSKDHTLGPGSYSVGVYGFKGTTKYNVSVTVKDTSKSNVGQQPMSSSSDGLTSTADTVECGNCKHYIPVRTIALHEAYCRRHNVICQHTGCGVVLRTEEVKNHVHCVKCEQAFHSTEMEKHMKVFHEPLSCACGVVLEKTQMVQHQSSECALRLVTCRFCGDMVQAGSLAVDARDRLRGLSEHESLCGSRTAPCDSCGRAVMLKEMDIHQVAVHQKN
ncbi:putative ubiquitin fusion degradation protein Ufd1 [Helianthus annuus]|uniref:Putative ubiquitin fusion degradation UFD1 family protein n=1 Tax=Helianthus annuus TaxID=4232 RepID=A0A251V2N6_HELAN|nr:uncharacterized protein LOC110938144 [Helianthus annuus]KAF5812229.1 putative ubiquitin fusion degradation protein Ufd1 [Helianthus annuus]KAJ0598788.1 putative ubiquitin fusion degradation protein Ufd1 [Helianthus annuus]KAJ0763045.1 putative ubiquitin fusion degradation protein Ufd1 [Helianthus annuus]KAJ0928996.1 putative ubiquitin fusion degradation protein Ufd1 [Helianthus annuus]